MMKSKAQVLEHLQITQLGKKSQVEDKFDGEVAAIVEKRNREDAFASVKWDQHIGGYRITFDPAPGMTTKIKAVFAPFAEEASVEKVASTPKPSEPKPAPKTQKKTVKKK